MTYKYDKAILEFFSTVTTKMAQCKKNQIGLARFNVATMGHISCCLLYT